ncbi:MAG: metallophosphoesterase [Planctomycetota bacterium]
MRWVVGDIHGMSGPLDVLVRTIQNRDAEASFYFTGDYCDRGPDTRGVVDRLIDLAEAGKATCTRGNHDDIFDLILSGESFASGPNLGGPVDEGICDEAARMFWSEGLPETLESYGFTGDGDGRWLDSVRDAIPQRHREFFRSLPGMVDAGDFFVAHAAWPPDYPDDGDQLARDPHLRYESIWGRYGSRQITTPKLWKRPCYSGHTPTDNYLHAPELIRQPGSVIFGEALTLLDTGAFMPRGRLSAVCHETRDVVQVHHSGELLS